MSPKLRLIEEGYLEYRVRISMFIKWRELQEKCTHRTGGGLFTALALSEQK